MIWAFATFIVASLLAVASPGPAFIALSHTAMNRSAREALAFALGLACIATFWCAMALYGLTAVFTYVPWLYLAMKMAGGAYLIYLAVTIWRGAAAPLPDAKLPPQRGMRAFFSGCAINLTNPKSVLFAGSILLAIFPMELTALHKVLILITLFAIEVSFYAAIVFWLSKPATRNAYLRLKVGIDRTAAAVLGALGIKFLLSRG